MPFPLAAALILSAIGGGIGSAIDSHQKQKAADQQNALNQDQLALQESQLNPFRASNAQMSSLMALDRAQNTTPASVGADPNGYSRLTPRQYTMSPELQQFLTELKARIASGTGANPAITQNYRMRQPNLNLSGAGPTLSGPVARDYDPDSGQYFKRV